MITSWFWLVGAVVLALLQNLIPQSLNGAPSVYTLALFVFAVAVALGSMAAARASANRPILRWCRSGAAHGPLPARHCLDCFDAVAGAITGQRHGGSTSLTGIHLLTDLAGVAFAGGLFIVPSFAAVQAWSPVERRSRVIAGCNVLSAAFMTFAGLTIAGLQYVKVPISLLYAGLGLANLVVVVLVLRAWGADGIKDVGVFLFKTFFGLEIRGLENLPKPGEKAVIAPNHVSLLDAPLMHSLLPSHSAYAVDTTIATAWWVRPFLKLARFYTIDPTRPLGMRHLIQDVKDGSSLVIFPEGRLTVTGGLMKVYDGTAMIADKADAPVIPVRIDGLSARISAT